MKFHQELNFNPWMNLIPPEISNMISSYLIPSEKKSISCSCSTQSRNIQLGTAIPYVIYNFIFGESYDIRELGENLRFIREVVEIEPSFQIEIWKDISDYLLFGNTKQRTRCFTRPHCGFSTRLFNTLIDAKNPDNWKSSPVPKATIKQHEIYRIDSIRLRSYKTRAPLAIALIY